MIVHSSKKNKITLTDYNYRRDIENRLLMSKFTVFEVEVLEEILNNTLNIPLSSLSDDLEYPIESIRPVAEKLSRTGLLVIKDEILVISKEMRKYFDFQVLKFDDNFKPGMEFLQGILRKVPIHVLPTWYALPKSADNIFSSIVEKFLETPKTFKNYIEDLQFEDLTLKGIVDDVYAAPELKIRARDLREKYNLTREQFEEYLLHLEFNFLCCLSYNRIGDEWKEVVTPFYEWKEYLLTTRKNRATKIEQEEEVVPNYPQPFGHVHNLAALLKICAEQQLQSDGEAFDADTITTLEQQISAPSNEDPSDHLNTLLYQLIALRFASVNDGIVAATGVGDLWLDMSPEEKSIFLYRRPSFCSNLANLENSDRTCRELEKGLKQIANIGWVRLEDFIGGLTVPIGQAEEVQLQKKGAKWRYVLPTYTDKERELIDQLLFTWFSQVSLIETGDHKGHPVFTVTDLGRQVLVN